MAETLGPEPVHPEQGLVDVIPLQGPAVPRQADPPLVETFTSGAARRQHLLLIASCGGHLAQLLALRPWWEDLPRTWVTFDTADARSQLTGEDVVFAHHPTTRNIPNLLRNFVVAERVLSEVRPTLVVSTGAAVAIPFFVLSRLRGFPTIYLEVFDRIDSRTVTGRVCRPFATEFLVQWDEQTALYKGSKSVGALL